MLKQDLQPDQNQNNAAGQLSAALVARTEHIADIYARKRDNKRRAADDCNGGHDIYLQKGKRRADRQCIDARCNGKDKKLFEVDARLGFFLLRLFAALADHV